MNGEIPLPLILIGVFATIALLAGMAIAAHRASR